MEIILVDTPFKAKTDNPDESHWCVDETGYPERYGGFKRWVEYLNKMRDKGATKCYLYDIKALNQSITNGIKDDEVILGEPEIIYYIRADFQF
jgi:hypothetical protein